MLCSGVTAADWVSPWSYTEVIPACLSFFPIAFHSLFGSSLPSHFLHLGAPEGNQCLVQCPACRAAATLGCDVSGHCLHPTLLSSGFAAEERLKNRKQNKAVRKSAIRVVSPKAEWHSRQLGSSGPFGALEREAVSLGRVWILSRTSYSAGLLV